MNARALGAEVAGLLAESRIVGGRPAKRGSHLFQVGILFKSVSDDYFAQYCGGALVASSFVVTAAHCSDFVSTSEVQVLTGTQNLDGSGVQRDVARIFIHPAWNPDTFDSDIAVWELTSHAAGIPVAKLAKREPRVGKKLLATGWGNTEAFGFPLELMEVKVPLVSRTNCNDVNSYNGLVTNHMICAGRDAGGKDTCQGDSGGPLTRKRNGKFKELVGITSWGAGCADPNLFGVYTRVSEFGAFVESIVR